MELLKKVMKYFTVFQPKNLSESQVSTGKVSPVQSDSSLEKRSERAKVAAIAAALHHHEMETSAQNNGSIGLAALVAAIHHHNKNKK